MVDCPLIGIMVPKRNNRKRILKLYQRHHNLTLKLFAFSREDILWEKREMIGLCLIEDKWKEVVFPFPHAVYNRCYNKKITTVAHLNHIIGRDKCFNSINWFNKWTVYNMLIQSNLQKHVPDTFLLNEVDLSERVKKYNLLYIKPFYGYHGNSVHRLELKKNGDIHISLHSLAPRLICRKNQDIQQKLDKLLGKKKYIVQKGIGSSQINNRNYDIRVLVQKDIRGKWMVSTMVCRVAYEQYFNTGAYEFIYDAEEILARIFPIKRRKETTLKSINTISLKAAQVIEAHVGLMGELSVDFVLDEENKLWIVELNGNPQKNIYKDINNFQYEQLIYSRPMEYAYYLSVH